MKYFFDTEFIEDGKTIDLLSIGMVCEDGRELYLENSEADLNKASDWVRENVFSHMRWSLDVQRPRVSIARAVYGFVTQDEYPPSSGFRTAPWPAAIPKPEFWAYYADYDWVVFCQLFGRMIDLPDGFPQYCRDFKQVLDQYPSFTLDKTRNVFAYEVEHNALDDARWLKREFDRFQRSMVMSLR